MFLFCSLIFATLAVTVGYFVLLAGGKAQGNLQKFGRVLAIWLFVLAAFPVLAGGYMVVSGHHSGADIMRGHMGSGMHGQRGGKWREHGEERIRKHIEEMHPSK